MAVNSLYGVTPYLAGFSIPVRIRRSFFSPFLALIIVAGAGTLRWLIL